MPKKSLVLLLCAVMMLSSACAGKPVVDETIAGTETPGITATGTETAPAETTPTSFPSETPGSSLSPTEIPELTTFPFGGTSSPGSSYIPKTPRPATPSSNNTAAPISPTAPAVPGRIPNLPKGSTVNWPKGQALPSFSEPVTGLDAIKITNLPYNTKLAVVSLQGIVNKKKPQILILNGAGEGQETWPKAVGLTYTVTSNYKLMIQKYAADIKGMVIFDQGQADTINLATTIAGLEDAIVVSPVLAEELRKAPYNIRVIKDLRSENFKNKLEVYEYLYRNYWSRCSKRVIVGMHPRDHLGLRDMAVAVQAAVLWLEPKISGEKAMLDKFFKDAVPVDTYYAGWWPEEGSGVGYGTQQGVITIPADYYENYTVYAGQSRQLEMPIVPAKPVLDKRKIYISLNFSDGDNIQYDQHALMEKSRWRSSSRGSIPIGWTCSPALLDAGPQILNYYYKTATPNDVLICGPSGLGYSSAENWRNQSDIAKYAALTNSYFEKTAFNIITIWSTLSTQKAGWMTQYMPSLLGMTTQNMTGSKLRFIQAASGENTIPVIWFGSDFPGNQGAMSYNSKPDGGVENMKQKFRSIASRTYTVPQFYAGQFNSWNTYVSDLQAMVKELNAEFPGRFVFVRPDHLMMLMNEANGKPFNTALQKPVKASGSAAGYAASQAVDGSFTKGWKASSKGSSWLQIDLGQSYQISRYVLKHAQTNYMASSYNNKAWQFQVSADGVNWVTIDTVANNTSAISYRTVSPTAARYIRVNITNAGADGYARIQDIEVYGSVI